MGERRRDGKGYFAKRVPGFSWEKSKLKFSRFFSWHHQQLPRTVVTTRGSSLWRHNHAKINFSMQPGIGEAALPAGIQ